MKFIETTEGEVLIATNDLVKITGCIEIDELGELDSFQIQNEIQRHFYNMTLVGRESVAYERMGGNTVRIKMEIDPDIALIRVLDIAVHADREKASKMLVDNYGANEFELSHALACAEAEYGAETVIPMGKREMRVPAFPDECSYVRFCADGVELTYWAEDEWASAPAEVMGAIVGGINKAIESKQEGML